jgi:hypothetical protein
MRFSNRGSIASGVTSRPVKPVPPVVMTTSIPGAAIQAPTAPRIASTSSGTILRSPSRWPALVRRSTRVSPERSSAGVRVSETVRTAMLRGTKGRLSSRGMGGRIARAVAGVILAREAATGPSGERLAPP